MFYSNNGSCLSLFGQRMAVAMETWLDAVALSCRDNCEPVDQNKLLSPVIQPIMNRQSATVQMKTRNPVCDSERREVSSSSSPLYTPANSKASTHAHMSLSKKPIIIVRVSINNLMDLKIWLLLCCCGAAGLPAAKWCKRRKHNDKKNKPTNIKQMLQENAARWKCCNHRNSAGTTTYKTPKIPTREKCGKFALQRKRTLPVAFQLIWVNFKNLSLYLFTNSYVGQKSA